MDIVDWLYAQKTAETRIAHDEIITLRNQLAECQKDAERYRWLSNKAYLNNKGWVFEHTKYHEKPTTLNADIDQAMSEKG